MERSWRIGKTLVTVLQSHSSHPFIFSNNKVCKDGNGGIVEEELAPCGP
jgi:hypothetical protein